MHLLPLGQSRRLDNASEFISVDGYPHTLDTTQKQGASGFLDFSLNLGDFVDDEQIVRVVEKTCSSDIDHAIARLEHASLDSPFGHFIKQRFRIVQIVYFVRHDPPEQAHAPKRMVRVANTERGDVVALLRFDPRCSAGSTRYYHQFGVNRFGDVRGIVGDRRRDRVHPRKETRFRVLRLRLEHFFRAEHDSIHGVDGNDREITNRRFAAQHASIRTIQNRIRHIARFGPRWTSIVMHAL